MAKFIEESYGMNKELWGDSIQQRLRAARQLSKPELESMIGNILRRCPLESWPYGNSTSINPLIVTLGPSPGGSPSGEDWDKPQAPTAGDRHPGTKYNDGKGYWDRVRFLVTRLLMTKGAIDEDDAYALFGNMNLDFHQSGDASRVQLKRDFGQSGNEIKIVHWPQHPSRAPFSNFHWWKTACDEFAERHGHLIAS